MRVLAVDLGATSIRVASVELDATAPAVEVLHRWSHGPIRQADGTLRWDWDGILREVERGLATGIAGGPVASIGIDGWGVDYGLIDDHGALVAPPFSYRDERTDRWIDVRSRIGEERLYAVSGVQLLPINTIFQLAVHDPAELDRADRILLLPDLLLHRLTGHIGAERSNASTTGLMDVHAGTWSSDLVEVLGLDPSLLPPLVRAGSAAGHWRDIPVHLVGSHDTASAFIAAPGVPAGGTAVVSSGTWVVVGTERPAPDTSSEAREANFSNEGGALGGIRFLRNVVGFWLLEQCRAGWGNPPLDRLLAEAAAVTTTSPIIDVNSERFRLSTDMEADIRAAAGGSFRNAGRGDVVRCILESIAAGVARTVEDLGTVGGTPIREILVVGGATRIGLMNELYRRHTGLPVMVGSAEATALGNAVVQGIALGRFADLGAARTWVAANATAA